jgi:spermidine synthase
MIRFFFYDDPSFTPPLDCLNQILKLYREQGWWEGSIDPDALARLIEGSHCFRLAFKEDEVVGMGRAISDRTSDAYIQDVAVKKAFRGGKIGSRIIQSIVKRLNADGIFWIGLIAEKDSRKFYEPIGFEKMPNSTPMIYTKKNEI